MATEPAGSTGTTPPPAGAPSAPTGAGGGTGPTTGADGPTGVVGSAPSHPRSQAPTPPPAKVWNHTKQGVQLEGAYGAMHQTFQHDLPRSRQNLQTLARRPLGG